MLERNILPRLPTSTRWARQLELMDTSEGANRRVRERDRDRVQMGLGHMSLSGDYRDDRRWRGRWKLDGGNEKFLAGRGSLGLFARDGPTLGSKRMYNFKDEGYKGKRMKTIDGTPYYYYRE